MKQLNKKFVQDDASVSSAFDTRSIQRSVAPTLHHFPRSNRVPSARKLRSVLLFPQVPSHCPFNETFIPTPVGTAGNTFGCAWPEELDTLVGRRREESPCDAGSCSEIRNENMRSFAQRIAQTRHRGSVIFLIAGLVHFTLTS